MALFLMNKGNVIGLNNIYVTIKWKIIKIYVFLKKICEKIKKNI